MCGKISYQVFDVFYHQKRAQAIWYHSVYQKTPFYVTWTQNHLKKNNRNKKKHLLLLCHKNFILHKYSILLELIHIIYIYFCNIACLSKTKDVYHCIFLLIITFNCSLNSLLLLVVRSYNWHRICHLPFAILWFLFLFLFVVLWIKPC